MKKKILALCLVVVLAVTAVTGATLAYFTDNDAQTNVFTYGNVKLDLFEDFNSENINLIPAVPVETEEEYGAAFENTIEKEVYVKNTGSEEAWVRVHIAIPAIAEGKNVISLLRDEFTTTDDKWNWSVSSEDPGYPGMNSNANWNIYGGFGNNDPVMINGVPYKVFVGTYMTKLNASDVTVDAINKVYMDPSITNEDIAAWDAKYVDTYGSPIWARVYVAAQAVQADGFDDPFVAFETAGMKDQLEAADFLAAPKGDTFVETTSLDGN